MTVVSPLLTISSMCWSANTKSAAWDGPMSLFRVKIGMYAVITLWPAERSNAEPPASKAKKLPRHPLPVVLLARLAVDQSVQGKGLGGFLLHDSMTLSLDLQKRSEFMRSSSTHSTPGPRPSTSDSGSCLGRRRDAVIPSPGHHPVGCEEDTKTLREQPWSDRRRIGVTEHLEACIIYPARTSSKLLVQDIVFHMIPTGFQLALSSDT